MPGEIIGEIEVLETIAVGSTIRDLQDSRSCMAQAAGGR
jgi:hypothetical protein